MFWGIPVLVFLVLAFDGNTHWDENNYLAKAAYAPLGFEEAWIHSWGEFYVGRLFHILLLKTYFILAGVGLIQLLGAEALMAVSVIGAGFLLSRSARLLGAEDKSAHFVFLCYVFSPLGLYLGYKSLAETTALLCVSAAVFLFLVGDIKRSGQRIFLASACLFAASFSRAESLLGFLAVAFPAVIIGRKDRGRAVGVLASVLGWWILFSLGFGLLTGLWSYRFFLFRSEAFAHNIAQDLTDYPPNFVSIVLFGGGMWLLALFGIVPARTKVSRIALAGLALSLFPLLIIPEHLEIRYLHPLLLPFALSAGLGLARISQELGKKMSSVASCGVALAILAGVVFSNQFTRPLQEVGVNGMELIGLVQEVSADRPDPLLFTSSVPNTYSFLRAAFPNLRLAGTPMPGMLMSLKISSPDDLLRLPPPWIYVSTRGTGPVPFGEHFRSQEVARRGRYVAYLLEPLGE